MKTMYKFNTLIIAFLTLSLLNSCVKDDDFEIPEAVCQDPTLTETKSVQEIFDAATDTPAQYTVDDVIVGYVTSSDQAGNFYKTITFQTLDGTLGFSVPVDQTDLYTIYNPGRKVYIKLQDLYTQIDFDALEIGALFEDSVGRLDINTFTDVLIKSCDDVAENDLVNQISIEDITDAHINTLVEFTNVQFEEGALGTTLYDENDDLGGATNHFIQDSSGETLIFRTSSFADFADIAVPEGRGAIRGVLTKFAGDYQLLARTFEDVNLDQDRVRIGFASSVTGTKVSIADARAKFTGSDTAVPDDEYIEGIITMTGIEENNISTRNAYVQDDTAGIAIRLSDTGTMISGDQVKISLKDVVLSQFRGLLQVNVTQNEHIELVDDGVALPAPLTVNLAELLTGNYESQLVQVESVQFDIENGTFSGSQNITDCVNSVPVYTSSSASFAEDTYPSGNGTIIGIASEFDEAQLILRNAEGSVGLTGERCEINASLETISNVRALFTGSDIDISELLKISGVVISDRTSGTVTERNLFLQDNTAGILVRFETDHTFNLGDEIEVIIQGETLSEYNGLLQVSAQTGNGIFIGAGTLPAPAVITIPELITGNFESQLVQIDNVQFDPETGTFSGSQTVTDCTDSFTIFTSSSATFADNAYPTGNGSIIGIASEFNTPQLTLRVENDTEGLTNDRCISAGGTTSNKVFFSELADPNNNAAARYIEIYNADTENLDLSGWVIRRYTNDNPSSTSSIDLTGITINAGEAFVIAAQATEFEAAFGFAPDLEAGTGGPADSNGDDNLELVDSNGDVVDTFGVPGEDGSGTDHEFEDGRALRNASVTEGNPTYTFSEWQIWNDTGSAGTTNEPQDAPGNFTPGVR